MATVLHHFYRLEVDEVTIIDKIGLKDEFSFADLARVMEEYALKAVEAGLQMQEKVFVLFNQWSVTALQRAATRVHERLKEEGIVL